MADANEPYTALLIATLASFALFPVTAVYVARRGGPRLVPALWLLWVGPLIAVWTLAGAPEMSVVWVGVPLTAAAIRASLSPARDTTLRRGLTRALVLTMAIMPVSFLAGLWWGLAACQGGCL